MNKFLASTLILFFSGTVSAIAQSNNMRGLNQIDESGNITNANQRRNQADSLGTHKEIPKGIKVWTVDERFGDRLPATPDTISHMYMNTIFTAGLRGEYNTLGNLGTPRINRIFIDRPENEQFIFTSPYDYFLTPVSSFHFTNTLSPFTNLSYNTCGDRTNGEDHFTAKFGVNAGKKIGVGFKFDYLYGRGYYNSQSTSHFNYTMYGSYMGERYQAHLLLSTNHEKVAENGGIVDDNYITHPESYSENFQSSEIPTLFDRNWNRNDNQHIFLSHRYNVGFNRKVKMTEEEIEAKKFALASQKENQLKKQREREGKAVESEENLRGQKVNNKETPLAGRPENAVIAGLEPVADGTTADRISVISQHTADSILAVSRREEQDTSWLKNEYVPVTSFIHTLKFDNYKRIYQAYKGAQDYYANSFDLSDQLGGDSIYDQTKHFALKNTFAISMLEGFNKWAKAGLKAFATSEIRHFSLPDKTGATTYNEHQLSIGAALTKSQGRTLHFNAIAETWLVGTDAGQLKLDAHADLNFPLWGDTVTLAATGFFHRLTPSFYYRHYHSRHLWWDNEDLDKMLHTRIQGTFTYQKTRTTLRIAADNIQNYTYFGSSHEVDSEGNRVQHAVNVRQAGANLNLFTVSLAQDFTLGPVNWENVITYQKSSHADVLPVPDINIYTNLYLRFKIAHVLKCDFGADARYFTSYYAPDYMPALGQYTVQEGENKVKTGNYPIVNVYANFHLKHTRFFVMFSHVNAGSGDRNYFLTPHYPLNDRIFRFGLSWNFFN